MSRLVWRTMQLVVMQKIAPSKAQDGGAVKQGRDLFDPAQTIKVDVQQNRCRFGCLNTHCFILLFGKYMQTTANVIQ